MDSLHVWDSACPFALAAQQDSWYFLKTMYMYMSHRREFLHGESVKLCLINTDVYISVHIKCSFGVNNLLLPNKFVCSFRVVLNLCSLAYLLGR